MKVVFTQDVPGVAQVGDVKDVANGHARNYLFPKGFAVLATPDELKRVESRKRAEAVLREQRVQEAESHAQGLDGTSLTFAKKARSTGSIYGSVSAMAIYQELKRLGHAVEKTMIKLEEPLKKLGTYDVEVELAKGLIATIKVSVEEAKDEAAEEVKDEPDEAGEEAEVEDTVEAEETEAEESGE